MKKLKFSFILIALFTFFLTGIIIRWALAYVDIEHAKAIYPVQLDCTHFEDAIDAYRIVHGVYPSESNGLRLIVEDKEYRKVLPDTNLNDPWGTPFKFRIIDGHPVVDSAGPDHKFDSSDDIKGFHPWDY